MRYILTLLLGAIIGAFVTFYFFVGAPRVKMSQMGVAVQAPEASGDPAGTAILTLDEKFFDTLLGTVFRDLGAPSFKLAATTKRDAPAAETTKTMMGASFINAQDNGGGGGCSNQVVIAQEANGVRTGVHLSNGQIVAPLAFSGSYGVLGNCMNFRGTAEADINLRFDQAQQTLYGQLNVTGVNLDGVPVLFSGPVTGFVQNSINQRVNPLVLMRGQQLSLSVPVQASGGTVKAQAKDVRSEVKDGALRLHVTYDFSGARGTAAPANTSPQT